MQNYKNGPLITDPCTHVRQELYDILGVLQLIRCFLLQEGKPEMKQSNMSLFRRSHEKKNINLFTM